MKINKTILKCTKHLCIDTQKTHLKKEKTINKTPQTYIKLKHPKIPPENIKKTKEHPIPLSVSKYI